MTESGKHTRERRARWLERALDRDRPMTFGEALVPRRDVPIDADDPYLAAMAPPGRPLSPVLADARGLWPWLLVGFNGGTSNVGFW